MFFSKEKNTGYQCIYQDDKFNRYIIIGHGNNNHNSRVMNDNKIQNI